MLSEGKIYEGDVATSRLRLRHDGAGSGFHGSKYRRVPFEIMLRIILLIVGMELPYFQGCGRRFQAISSYGLFLTSASSPPPQVSIGVASFE